MAASHRGSWKLKIVTQWGIRTGKLCIVNTLSNFKYAYKFFFADKSEKVIEKVHLDDLNVYLDTLDT